MRSGIFNPQGFARQGLTLIPAAAIHIHELVAKQPGMIGVCLGVKQTGHAGLGYVLDSVSEPDKDDLLFEHDGVKLFVLLQAMPSADGTEVDFVREGPNQIFKLHNPRVQNEYGCGESFGVQAALCLVILKQLMMSRPGPAAH